MTLVSDDQKRAIGEKINTFLGNFLFESNDETTHNTMVDGINEILNKEIDVMSHEIRVGVGESINVLLTEAEVMFRGDNEPTFLKFRMAPAEVN